VNCLKIAFVSCLIMFSVKDNVIKLAGVPELFTTDKLGNCYTYKDNLLTKISPEGKIIGQHTSFDSGQLFFIDANDPMQILLFYKDFNQVVLLDNKLNPLGNPIYLDKLDLSSVTAVCKSKQFAIWIYDEYSRKLVHYGFNPKAIIQTINLDKFGKEIGSIDFIQESGNEIYMRESNNCIWVFDQFGSKLDKIEIDVLGDFQIRNKMVLFNNHKRIFWYDLQNGTLDSMKINGFEFFDKARFENNLIYVVNKDSLVMVHFEKLN
jgi:hypothetical protein